MKNKILASLLAVCLFAGLAVPAFASTTSTVAGDGSKVTIMEFKDKSYDLKQDVAKNFVPELRVYESTKKLVLDYQQISWALEGQGTAFTIETDSTGVFVTALEKTGTATLIAKDDQSGKVVAKTTLKAVPNPAKGFALSFKYANQTNIQLPVGPDAEDQTIVVNGITVGNQWTDNNQDRVSDAVVASIEEALKKAGANVDHTTTPAGAVVPAVAAKYEVDLTGMSTGSITSAFGQTVNVSYGATIPATATALKTALNSVAGFKDLFTADAAANVVTITAKTAGKITAANDAIYKTALVGDASITTKTVTNSTLGADETPATAEIYNGVRAGVKNSDNNNLEFKIDAGFLATIAPDASKKYAITTVAKMGDKEDKNQKDITAKTNLTVVKTVQGKTIACVPNKTIEVGQTFDLADTVKVGASSANVRKATGNYSEVFYNESSEANDYAIVNADGTTVTGVAVGKNKIAVELLGTDQVAYCTVTVVEKGTKPADATGTNTVVLSNWAPKLGVGETANIVVKATNGVTYTSLDTAIVTVDAAGKLTAVKEGTAKVKVQENDKDAVYLTVTVTAATTKPTDKPTDVPQTAVVALAPLF